MSTPPSIGPHTSLTYENNLVSSRLQKLYRTVAYVVCKAWERPGLLLEPIPYEHRTRASGEPCSPKGWSHSCLLLPVRNVRESYTLTK
jgi:hypothetical protein